MSAAMLPDDFVRVLYAPCGCVCAADFTADAPGFCRTHKEAQEDMALGFHEATVTDAAFQAMTLRCTHDPEWGVER